MKKITKRLSIRREVLQHLELREAAGGSLTKPGASCINCPPPSADTICTTNGNRCKIGPTGVC